jgi:hypothetical protein
MASDLSAHVHDSPSIGGVYVHGLGHRPAQGSLILHAFAKGHNVHSFVPVCSEEEAGFINGPPSVLPPSPCTARTAKPKHATA